MAKKNYSRLSRRLENQSRKNLVLSILGIIIVLFLLMKFGIPLLVNFSVFLSGTKNASDTTQKNSTTYMSPPNLNPVLNATNSSQLKISGNAGKKQTVNIYLNGSLTDKAQTESNGDFSFDITLRDGENLIKTKAIKDNEESDFSNELSIIYKNVSPKLDISSPSDGAKFEKDQNSVNVSGSTDSGVRITVNDFWAIIDENNNFSYTFTFRDGDNEIKVIAIDEAGNKTEKSLRVNFSP